MINATVVVVMVVETCGSGDDVRGFAKKKIQKIRD